MWKPKGLDTVCSVCTSGVSVVCMSSMGAALAAAETAGGAGAMSMAGAPGWPKDGTVPAEFHSPR